MLLLTAVVLCGMLSLLLREGSTSVACVLMLQLLNEGSVGQLENGGDAHNLCEHVAPPTPEGERGRARQDTGQQSRRVGGAANPGKCCTLTTQEVLSPVLRMMTVIRRVYAASGRTMSSAEMVTICQRKKGAREVLLTLSCGSLPGRETGMHAGVWTPCPERTISVAKGQIILPAVYTV